MGVTIAKADVEICRVWSKLVIHLSPLFLHAFFLYMCPDMLINPKTKFHRKVHFLKMTGNEILRNAGEISHKQAIEKAQIEYEKYKEIIVNEISKVEQHFIEQIETSSKKTETKKRGK